MYRCTECGAKFHRPKRVIIDGDIIFERGREIVTKEESYVCPVCRSENIEEKEDE